MPMLTTYGKSEELLLPHQRPHEVWTLIVRKDESGGIDTVSRRWLIECKDESQASITAMALHNIALEVLEVTPVDAFLPLALYEPRGSEIYGKSDPGADADTDETGRVVEDIPDR